MDQNEKRPPLYFAIQNARDDGLLRKASAVDLGKHTIRNGLWFATDTGRAGFVKLFREIDEHLAVVDRRVVFKSYTDAVSLARKVTAAVDLALDAVKENIDISDVGPWPFLFAFDVEQHQLKTDLYPNGRVPFIEEIRDTFLGKLLLGQAIVRARQRFALNLLPTFYRVVRPCALVSARGDDSYRWGQMDPAFEDEFGGAAVSEILMASGWYWAHSYIGESEEGWKGTDPYRYGFASAQWHKRQMALAGVSHLPAVLVDWAYTAIDEHVEPWMRGAIDAEWPGALAVAGDWQAGVDDSDQPAEQQALEIAGLWKKYVHDPLYA